MHLETACHLCFLHGRVVLPDNLQQSLFVHNLLTYPDEVAAPSNSTQYFRRETCRVVNL